MWVAAAADPHVPLWGSLPERGRPLGCWACAGQDCWVQVPALEGKGLSPLSKSTFFPLAHLSCPSWQSFCSFGGLSPVLGFLLSYLSPVVSPSFQTHCQGPDTLPVPAPFPHFCPVFSSRMPSPFSPFPALFCALPQDPWLPSLPVSLSPPPVLGPCPSLLFPVPRVLALVPAALQMHAFCFLAARVPAALLWPAQERWAPSSPGPGPIPVWAAVEMKGVLGFSVPRLVCAHPPCG